MYVSVKKRSADTLFGVKFHPIDNILQNVTATRINKQNHIFTCLLPLE
jgi:hypothetical protein